MISYWKNHRERIGQSIDDFFASLGKMTVEFFEEFGQSVLFFVESAKLIFAKPYRIDEIIRHIELIGNKSILIILLTGLFTGLALSFQIYLGFQLVNATNLVGPTVGLGITRELGPVLTGLIVAARAGGAMAARLGTMRVSEQIDAIQVMGINPKQYLVAPRIVAALVAMPLLCAVFDFIAMMGAKFICIDFLDLDQAIFWDKIQLWLDPGDINQGLIKAAVFGMAFTAICTNKGYNASGGAKGVGEATNRGVVNSMVMIIVLNFFLTNIIRFFYSVMGWS